jgi:alkylation response protein AidB-like acyl-CoA dehydrogenase
VARVVVLGGRRYEVFDSAEAYETWNKRALASLVLGAPVARRVGVKLAIENHKDWRIEDNWHVMGLKGTGSKDVVVDGCFIPEHRTHKLIDGYKRSSPGNEINKAPLYRLPFGQVFVRSVSTTAIGIAQGALDAYRKNTASRIAASDGAKVALDPSAQMVASRAHGVIEDLRGQIHRNFDEMMAQVRAGEDLPPGTRRAIERDLEPCLGSKGSCRNRCSERPHRPSRYFCTGPKWLR